MELARRGFLKVLGGVGIASGGYLAYDEMTSGQWLYDPAALTAARSKFFGQMDFATLYEAQQKYGSSSSNSSNATGTSASGMAGAALATTEDIDPSKFDSMAMVGSVSISGDNGVPTELFSLAMTGSFDAKTVTDLAKKSDQLEKVDKQPVSGYEFWEADVPDELLSGSSVGNGTEGFGGEQASADGEFEQVIDHEGGTDPGGDGTQDGSGSGSESGSDPSSNIPDLQPKTVAMGVDDGAFVTGAARAPKTDQVTSMTAAAQPVRAKRNGGGVSGPKLLVADKDYKNIRSQFASEPTFLFGALLDPALVTLSVALTDIILGFAGDLGSEAVPGTGGVTNAVSVFLEQWVEDLRAGAMGGTVDMDAEMTTMKLFMTYSTADAAKQTGIVQFVNAGANMNKMENVKEVKARYQGKSIVVTVEAKNEAVFDPDTGTTTDSTGNSGTTLTELADLAGASGDGTQV